ncbi:MAG: PepSY domain-containing protein [Rhodocyclaceae bacterium]|nr:PepSY domain-containing protein [Rhodocyclaceae bacterium]
MPRLSLLRTLLIAVLLAAAPAHAIDRDQAAAQVQKQTGGRVLSVDSADRDGRKVFRVKVLTRSGEVRIVVIDAKTGRVR